MLKYSSSDFIEVFLGDESVNKHLVAKPRQKRWNHTTKIKFRIYQLLSD